MSSFYVDVHTHLTHHKFDGEVDSIVENAKQAGLGAIICNGLDKESNRRVLEIAKKHPVVKPALGIYPLNVLQNLIDHDPALHISKFDIEEELNFIESQAKAKNIIALGECGLDGYWVKEDTFPEQERVFVRFIELAIKYDLPLIIHTRKLEKRSIEILDHHNVERVDFHCYGSKVKIALKAAEKHDWCFSIPANARKNEAFAKLLAELPKEKILTETDAPYLAPIRETRNEPANVVDTIKFLSEIRDWSEQEAKDLIWSNYLRLFKPDIS